MKTIFEMLQCYGFLLLVSLSACVSAGKYNDLEAADQATQKSLTTCEDDRADLNRKLGITSSEKTELEGSMANLKRALNEAEARKAETEKRLAEFRELTDKFKSLVDAGRLSIKVRDGRMLIALSSDILFASGSAQLSKSGAEEITEVSALLKDLHHRNFQVEGHTDNVPIHTKNFPSNWELAAARASSVLNTMLAAGFPPEHVSLASYGKYDPLNENRTPKERAENRRIAIVVVPDLSGLPGYEELNRMSSSAATGGTNERANELTEDEPISAMPEPVNHATPAPQPLPDLNPTTHEVKAKTHSP